MEGFINWISTNKEWLFSGLGGLILLPIVRYIWKRNRASQSEPSVSNTATGNRNYQAGRDINIQKEEKKN
ncbi:MAG: hypothetical protein IPN74_05625 [Haliscomenobacter sp.]|nr:hypothetical protein [Haliscomenobacter sp.]MBK8878032.1 hypothetical protein [Haliscomenobacter sp.]